jgi:PBSX family phage terminase large subunit
MELGQFGEKAYDFICTPIEQDARINILTGSVRSGKTVAMIPKVLMILKSPLGKGLGVITGVSKDTVYDNVLRDLFGVAGEDNFKYNRQSGDLVIFGCNVKIIGAKDEGSEKYIRGKTIAWAYCDELSLMPERFFKQLLNRMSVKGARLYGTTNPDSPFHYLYTEFITDVKKLTAGMVKAIHFELEDNPNLDEEYLNFIRSAYTGLWFLRMILGQWVLAQGAIYDMYDDELNSFDDSNAPPMFKELSRRYIPADYGTNNPTVFLDCYDDGVTIWVNDLCYYDGRKEAKQRTDVQHADALEKMIGTDYPIYVIIDPSALSFKLECRNRGIRVKDADNEVLDGIRMTSTMISKRNIRIHKRKSLNPLRKEFASYIWDEKAVKRGEDKPIKENDHCLDALRYLVKTIIKPRRLSN